MPQAIPPGPLTVNDTGCPGLITGGVVGDEIGVVWVEELVADVDVDVNGGDEGDGATDNLDALADVDVVPADGLVADGADEHPATASTASTARHFGKRTGLGSHRRPPSVPFVQRLIRGANSVRRTGGSVPVGALARKKRERDTNPGGTLLGRRSSRA